MLSRSTVNISVIYCSKLFLWWSERIIWQSIGRYLAPLRHIIQTSCQLVFALTENTNIIVFWTGSKPTIYCTWGRQNNHYTTVYLMQHNVYEKVCHRTYRMLIVFFEESSFFRDTTGRNNMTEIFLKMVLSIYNTFSKPFLTRFF